MMIMEKYSFCLNLPRQFCKISIKINQIDVI